MMERQLEQQQHYISLLESRLQELECKMHLVPQQILKTQYEIKYQEVMQTLHPLLGSSYNFELLYEKSQMDHISLLQWNTWLWDYLEKTVDARTRYLVHELRLKNAQE